MTSVAHLDLTFRSFIESQPRLILGSNSASRKKVLNELAKNYKFSFEVTQAGIDEKSIRRNDPKDLVLTLGYAKAKVVINRLQSEQHSETYVITGDQVVVHNGRILEKPESEKELRSNIKGFALTPASTIGSIICTHLPSKTQLHCVDIATIYMNSLPDEVVDKLIEEGDVFHSAGGLLAEHPLVSPYVTKIDGDLDTIMGLSKTSTMILLTEMWQNIKPNT